MAETMVETMEGIVDRRIKFIEGEYFPDEILQRLVQAVIIHDKPEDTEGFITHLIAILGENVKHCDACERVDLDDLDCIDCPNNECEGCTGDEEAIKKSIEEAYDKRAILIRSLQFPHHMNSDIIAMSNGLSDKDFIERLISYLKGLENIYGDVSPVEEIAENNENSADYWHEQCRQLRDELENTRCNHEDDYDEMVADNSDYKERINYLNEKFDFFVNAVKNNISFTAPLYLIVKHKEIIAVCLTKGEAIDRTSSLNAGSSDFEFDMVKKTLLELCEETGDVDHKRIILEKLQDKFDNDCDNSESVIAIRKKLFK